VIFPRQGLQSFNPLVYRNVDGTQGANLAANKWREWDADACFVDNTGGFGSSWCDNLRRLGFSPIPVHFSEKPGNGKYFNKRAEMMFECVEWIKGGGAIPNRPELIAALTQTTYTFKGDKLMIEPKDVIKVKLGYSPDEMDALMLTFASPVAKNVPTYGGKNSRYTFDYDPLNSKYIEG
jgi:phage terminase large subunit